MENAHQIIINATQAGKRADRIIASEIPHISRSRVKEIFDAGQILLNDKPLKSMSVKLKFEDQISLIVPPAQSTEIKPNRKIPLNIVYEDDDIIVINKQAGLTVHPGAGNHSDTLVNALIAYQGENLSAVNGRERPGILHRLDRDTSGLMLVAKNDIAHQFLAEELAERRITRVYHALVWNAPNLVVGSIDIKIGRNRADRKKMSVYNVRRRTNMPYANFDENSPWNKTPQAKPAVTHYKLLEKYYDGILSLLECRLETGRTHQIRVHMEHKHMPLVGDPLYFGQPTYKKHGSIPEGARNAVVKFHRQALCAKYIGFTHPTTGEEMEFEIDYPADFQELLDIIEASN